MVYEPLPIIEVDLDDLQLDLDNYRIPTHRDDERAAMIYLFASEDVVGAAKSILRNGYFDNEVPVVYPEGDLYIVQEGNRRVSALKALQRPDFVPASEAEIRTLLRRYAIEAESLPTSIRVMVAQDRDQAAPHIARLHTGLSKKGWSLDQQANYYFSLLGPHVTVDDLKAQYPDVSIPRFVKMAVMRRFLAGVKFKDRTLHGYVDGSELAMSAFEYAYRRSAISAAIGVAFNRDGFLLPADKAAEQIGHDLSDVMRTAVEYLMTEFRGGRLNTRSRQFKEGTEENSELVQKLLGAPADPADAPEVDDVPGDPADAPDDGPADVPGDPADAPDDGPADVPGDPADAPEVDDVPGDGPDVDGAGQAEADNPDEPDNSGTSSRRGPNHPHTKDRLQLNGLDYSTYASVNLQKRYHELRGLSLSVFPAAASMMLRSVLETTIKFHFESTSTPVAGQLKPAFGAVATAYGKLKPVQQAIARIDSGGASVPGTIAWFNLVAHSADAVVKPQDVRDALELLHPVLRLLLRPAP